MNKPSITPYGDNGLLIQFLTQGYSRSVTETILGLSQVFRGDKNWIEVVSAYDSLMLVFDPLAVDPYQAEVQAQKILKSYKPKKFQPGRLVEIPVYYGGEDGPDMNIIMASSGLSEEAVIALHSRDEYLVCMMGFIPGFAFLSEAPEKLHHARHTTPRESVPAGSVGIAGWQTGIYGLESPGGWQIIGRTDIELFNAKRDEPFYVEAGDRVKFMPSRRTS